MESESELLSLAWPAERLGEALELTARRAGLTPAAAVIPGLPDVPGTDATGLSDWMELACMRLGIEAEAVETSLADLDSFLSGVAPALLQLPPGNGTPYFLAALKSGRGGVVVLTPESKVRRLPVQALGQAILSGVARTQFELAGELLDVAGIPPERRTRARAALTREFSAKARMTAGWLLRTSPGQGFSHGLQRTPLARELLTLLAAQAVQQALLVAQWWFIGRGALSGHFERVWLIAWVLLLFTGIPLQWFRLSAENRLAIRLGGAFKRHMLYGSLKLRPDEIRHQGLGQFLGRVMEAEAIELLSLTGGLGAVTALVQLASAGAVLAAGAGGWTQTLMLAVFLLVTVGLGWVFLRRSLECDDVYRSMTNDLVERMVGHRTRLVQEDRRRWHFDEDRDLERYFGLSGRMDQVRVMLAVVPRAWAIAGLAGLMIAYVREMPPAALVAVGVGGVVLGSQSLATIVEGIESLAQAAQAWREVKPLFAAAARPDDVPAVVSPDGNGDSESRPGPVILAKDIAFRYGDRGRQVLDGVNLEIRRHDRLLLEGPSGGGKTTLAAVLSGLRDAQGGVLLLNGYDRPTLGSAQWRRGLAVAPQFHENHVFSGTFAFNLLMGRRWPPTEDDLREAEAICEELGLGDLLRRMPSGMQQMVGESGWQTSHGERSRMYIARALLQRADVIILDESFAALDPENLRRSLECVIRRAPALLVIAHP